MAKLMTHELLVEKIKIKNPTFFDNYEILDSFAKCYIKLKIKSRYGLHLMDSVHLIRGALPNIQNAINKTEYLNEQFKQLQPELYSQVKIISEYVTNKNLMVQDKYGICKTNSYNLITRGCVPNIEIAINKTEYFINQAKETHGDYYSYENLNYINSTTPVIITCPVHGDFPQNSTSHLAGCGCDKCVRLSKFKTIETFIKEANIVHNNCYTYENAIYTRSDQELLVTCSLHGDFPVRPSNHLNGQKCIKCSRQFNSFSYSQWIEAGLQSNNFEGFQFYILKCWNETEEFYKIGKTFTNISKRYHSHSLLPYNWKVEHSIIGDGNYICHLEHSTHNNFKDNHYEPLIKFGGSKTECFKFDDIQVVIDFANNFKM